MVLKNPIVNPSALFYLSIFVLLSFVFSVNFFRLMLERLPHLPHNSLISIHSTRTASYAIQRHSQMMQYDQCEYTGLCWRRRNFRSKEDKEDSPEDFDAEKEFGF